jgi:hypothetical protein
VAVIQRALDEVVLPPGPEDLGRDTLVLEAGEHDDRDLRRLSSHLEERIEPLAIRERQVEHDNVDAPLGEPLQAGPEAISEPHPETRRGRLAEDVLDQVGIMGVVLDQEDCGSVFSHLALLSSDTLTAINQQFFDDRINATKS